MRIIKISVISEHLSFDNVIGFNSKCILHNNRICTILDNISLVLITDKMKRIRDNADAQCTYFFIMFVVIIVSEKDEKLKVNRSLSPGLMSSKYLNVFDINISE